MVLTKFQKPSRYINGEINCIKKNGAFVGVALVFPDIYDVGMSHLGLKILYDIINGLPYAKAERAFHPWVDMEAGLKAKKEPIRSLESGAPLKEFDIIGFSLQYEMSYTSVLNMLHMSGLPLKSAERDSALPLILAGGPCTINPMPMADYFDAFLIGDAEYAITEITACVNEFKQSGHKDKSTLLKMLSNIVGVYIPTIHDGHDGRACVKRRYIDDLDKVPCPTAPIVPYAEIIHDRIAVEVSRGCAMGCRFCQAGMIYRPVRERLKERVLEIAEASVNNTGYEEVAFVSLSAGDYSELRPLLTEFNRRMSGRKVSVSLPSLRVKAVNEHILREIRSVKKTGFTIAPEAATDRLRAVINKDFSEDDFMRAVETLFKEGWLNLKLYYMIGLPTETDADIKAITDMVARAQKTARRHAQRSVGMSVSISPFAPKAHTPFQWCGMDGMQSLRQKRDYLRRALRKVNFRGHDIETSMLEAAMARGDRKTGELILSAFRLGARLEGWSECFDFNIWEKAAHETGIDPVQYATRSIDTAAELPWDMVDTGIKKEFLVKEYENALKSEKTPGCSEQCGACGLKCKSLAPMRPALIEAKPTAVRPALNGASARKPIRVRLKFEKTGVLRLLSHRELMTHMMRAMNRAGIPLLYTQGFHPTPKTAFGPPLSVGMAGLNEYVDMEVTPLLTLSAIKDGLNATLGDGVRVSEAASIKMDEPSLQAFVTRYVYDILYKDIPAIEEAMRKLDDAELMVAREQGSLNIRPMIAKAEIIGENTLRLVLEDQADKKVRLDEVAQALLNQPASGLDITRVGMFGMKNGVWAMPL